MERFSLNDFIQQHNMTYKNYFETVISPEGVVEYAIPSHIYKLEMIWGVPFEELYSGGVKRDKLLQQMPMAASPTHWLVDNTGYVAAWFDRFICSVDITDKQIKTIAQLIKEGCMYSQVLCEVTIENRREFCFKSNSCDIQKLEKLIQRARDKEQDVLTRIYDG